MPTFEPVRTRPERAPMVDWYAPLQLLQTAQRVVVSTLFGQYSDQRLLEALADADCDDPAARPFDDYSGRGELTVDYVGDSGDGWNSTYAVAYWLGQPVLTVVDPAGARHELPRGDVLVFGGDEVYPTPSRAAYETRLVRPYAAALNGNPSLPDAYAIPGNHDWYDGLVSFTRLFCSRETFAGCRAPQRRSYFALKLPGGWWLIGTDVQLGSDIDKPQLDYFRGVAAVMKDEDRVILCNAEPHWVYDNEEPNAVLRRMREQESNLWYLEQKIFPSKVRVFLAGDLHHYRRHADAAGCQKITAGGGGAFLHPTHGWNEAPLAGGFELKKAFPEPDVSASLTKRNLWFLLKSPRFGVVTGLLYVFLGWSAADALSRGAGHGLWFALRAAARVAMHAPGGALFILATFGGFYLFTDTSNRTHKVVGGSLHALVNLASALAVSWAFGAAVVALGWDPDSVRVRIGLLGTLLSGGWVLGSVWMGLYLYISLNWRHRHRNEAFSALRIEDYKSFLRMRIGKDGVLRIFPIGIERVPRTWRADADPGSGKSCFVPADRRATAPVAVEPPIEVTR